jgi:uncharacterized glyoxalase superfamily protein PhnB
MGFELGWTAGEPPNRASFCRDNVEITVEVEAVPARAKVYIQVSGVYSYFEKIATAGAIVSVPLADRFYGMRDGRVDDPDGNAINLGEPLEPGTDS